MKEIIKNQGANAWVRPVKGIKGEAKIHRRDQTVIMADSSQKYPANIYKMVDAPHDSFVSIDGQRYKVEWQHIGVGNRPGAGWWAIVVEFVKEIK